jgi:hypothetical protein
MFEAIVVPVGLVAIGGYIHLWVKSNVNEANWASVKDLVTNRFDDLEAKLDERYSNSNQRLDRIERAMNGHLKDV